MNEAEEMRMDKWLFAVRLFKTRSQATEACRTGKVHLNDSLAKAAKPLRVGDTVSVRQSPITRTLKVVGLTGRRVGAKLVADFSEDKTLPAELEKLRLAKHNTDDSGHKKTGRPSKRDRRLIHRFTDPGPA
jgi:ribosome-associated heat shock protein Hsp15